LRSWHAVCNLNMQRFFWEGWLLRMAIIFTNASYQNLTATSGTPGHLSYIGRLAAFDARLEKQLDFSHLGDDLVYSRLWLPDGAPAEFTDVERLAVENDLAEMRRVRQLTNRERLPQIGIALISALPPDREITLDEAKEIAWQIVSEARRSYRLAVYLVIHDPGLKSPGARNRHSHAFMLTREIGPAGLAPAKLRKGIALVRNGGGSTFVGEGINWPDLTGEVLRTKLLEYGSDVTVDLIAPYPQTHLRPAGRGSNTGRLAFHRAQKMDDNLAAIQGDPRLLLEKLLRGRSTLEIEALRGFVAKCIDSSHDRDAAVDRILNNPEVVTLADTVNRQKARFVTTAAINGAIEYAVELVDRSKRGAATIHTAVGADHAAVVAAINALLDDGSVEPGSVPLVVGSRLSDCDDMTEALGPANPEVATLKAVLAGVSAEAGRRKRRALPPQGLAIVPRAERIGDQDLAELLDLAEQSETLLVLGKDLSVETGVVANRLVCHAVDRLTPLRTLSEQRISAERLLRAGLTTAAVKTLADRLTFAPLDSSLADPGGFDFVVCTNGKALKAADKELAAAYGRKCAARGEYSFVAELTHGPAVLWRWQPIVFTHTDYGILPPKIREGQGATIFSTDIRTSTIQALLSDGQLVSVSTRKFPWIRSGFALSIREARQIKEHARLRIELGDTLRAWAALVLAARQRRPVSVVIDPMVARDADALATVLSGSLPGALPSELYLRPDANAEISAELAKVTDSIEIEAFPTPDAVVPEQAQPALPVLLANDVRDLLASDKHAASAFELLSELLHPDKQCDELIAAKLQTLCAPNSLTMYVVNQLRHAHRIAQNADQQDDDLDMPRELTIQDPRQWTTIDLSLFKSDLFYMFFPGSELDITSIDPARDFRRPSN
jgi:MobA/MobL family